MKWPLPHEIAERIDLPAGFTVDFVDEDDLQQLPALLRDWYPDIVTGAEGRFLDAGYLREQVYLKHGDPQRPVYAFVFRGEDGIAAFFAGERDERARSISGRLGAVAPQHRGSGLGIAGLKSFAVLGELSGAALVWGGATLKHPLSQVAYERAGFQLVGIMPANDRDEVAPGRVKYVYEAIYARVCVDPDELEIPSREAMTPRTQALWDFLFGGNASDR
jgi:hypothetical protein